MHHSLQLRTVQDSIVDNKITFTHKPYRVRDPIHGTTKEGAERKHELYPTNTPHQAYYSLVIDNPDTFKIRKEDFRAKEPFSYNQFRNSRLPKHMVDHPSFLNRSKLMQSKRSGEFPASVSKASSSHMLDSNQSFAKPKESAREKIIGMLNDQSVREIADSNLKQVMHAYDSLETPIKINSWYEDSERKKNDYGVRRSVMVSTQKQTDSCLTQQNFSKTVEDKLTPKPRFSKLCNRTDLNLLSEQVSLEIEEFSQRQNQSVLVRNKHGSSTVSNWFCKGYASKSPAH